MTTRIHLRTEARSRFTRCRDRILGALTVRGERVLDENDKPSVPAEERCLGCWSWVAEITM